MTDHNQRGNAIRHSALAVLITDQVSTWCHNAMTCEYSEFSGIDLKNLLDWTAK